MSEKWEQLELPFEGKPKSKPVQKVTPCMKAWAEIRDHRYHCMACGQVFETMGDYNKHIWGER